MSEYLEKRMSEIESKLETTNESKIISLSELMSKHFDEKRWTVEKLVPEEGVTIISGAPCSYKTWIILMLAIEVSQGGLLFGQFPTKQCGVLIVDEESGERGLRERLDVLELDESLPIYFLSFSDFELDQLHIDPILKHAKENNIGLVIFDSLVRIHSGDENDAGQMSRALRFLKKLNAKGVTVIVTHHNRKRGKGNNNNLSEEMRGSSEISAFLDSHIAVEEKKSEEVTVQQPKLRQGKKIEPFKIKFVEDENGNCSFAYEGETIEMKGKDDQRKIAITTLLKEHDKLFQQQMLDLLIKSGLMIGESTLRVVLKELIQEEVIKTSKGGGNTIYYSLKNN